MKLIKTIKRKYQIWKFEKDIALKTFGATRKKGITDAMVFKRILLHNKINKKLSSKNIICCNCTNDTHD